MPVVALPDGDARIADLDEAEAAELQDERPAAGAAGAGSRRERPSAAADAVGATLESLAKRGFRRCWWTTAP